jgi:iron complex transport system substrate-binding protein
MASIGHFDGLAGMYNPEENFPKRLFDRLPGFETDLSGVSNLFPGGADTADKEILYELDPDLNVVDPYVAKDYLGFDESDITDVGENVAPFFGSFMRRPQYTENHPYSSLYEGTERIARAFGEEERFADLEAFHDDVRSRIQERLPPATDRPSYAYMNMNWWGDFTEVYARQTNNPGYQYKPFRDLDVRPENNAFRGEFPDERRPLVKTDVEGLLEADPELIIWHGGYSLIGGAEHEGTTITWEEDIVGRLQDDPVASEVTAIAEGNVVPGNLIEVGPVSNLFNMEDLAKQLYPEEFGEFSIEEYPDGERLFERQALADVVTGEY